MTINGYQIDWMAISAIATLLMALATFLALWQSRKQLAEMKRQWDEEHKPKIEASIVNSPWGDVYGASRIQLINYGNAPANNIKIRFGKEFIEGIPNVAFRLIVEHLEKGCYHILPNDRIYLYFAEFEKDRFSGKTNSFLLHFTKLSEQQMFDIIQYLKKPFKFEIEYGDEHRYISRFELSYDDILSSQVLTVQESLNQIQKQIRSLRKE